MTSERTRDFFLEAGIVDRLSDKELMDGFARVSDIRELHSVERLQANAWALWFSEGYRREFFAFLRHAAWVLRVGKGVGSNARIEDAKNVFAEAVQLLAYAGFDMVHVRQLVGCLSHSCTCDGCDLISGSRFDRLAAEIETPATVASGPGARLSGSQNEPIGGACVGSASEV